MKLNENSNCRGLLASARMNEISKGGRALLGDSCLQLLGLATILVSHKQINNFSSRIQNSNVVAEAIFPCIFFFGSEENGVNYLLSISC